MKSNTNSPASAEALELQRLVARASVLTTVITSRKDREQAALKAKVDSLPALFGKANLKDVINIIREVGDVRTRAEIDDAKRKRIVNHITSGKFTPAQIAQIEDVSIPSVHAIRQAAGIKVKRGRPMKVAA